MQGCYNFISNETMEKNILFKTGFIRCILHYLFLNVYIFPVEEHKVEEEEEMEEEDLRNYDYNVIYDDYYTKKRREEDNEDEDLEDFSTSPKNITILGLRSVSSYFEIIPTPLIPMMIEGGASYILRGMQQSIILEPTLYTIDPDYHMEDEVRLNFVFVFMC